MAERKGQKSDSHCCGTTISFVLGRSGSGKTYHCLKSIRRELSQNTQGCRLILLVPEQATFQMEQALVAGDGPKGYHRARVTSFERLAREILQQTKPSPLSVLSENAKQMILRELLQKHAGELTIFARSAGSSGFITQMSQRISELRQYQRTPEELSKLRENMLRDNDGHSSPLIEKLGDLACIYQAYLDCVDGQFIDPDDNLDLVLDRACDAVMLRGGRLWVDGFAGFTPQQFAALKVIVAAVDDAQISLCLDPYSPQFHIAHHQSYPDAMLDETDLFHPTLQTYNRLLGLFTDVGVQIAEPMILPAMLPNAGSGNAISPGGRESDAMPRFEGAPKLTHLERRLFAENDIAHSEHQSRWAHVTAIPTDDLVVVAAPNRRVEVNAVARHILTLCREHDYRFRDIAVILREVSDYQELLEASFADHGIAFFMDQRGNVRHHPLIEMLRSALAVLCGNFRSELIFDYLKTDLPGLSRYAVDTLENYVLAHGIELDQWLWSKQWKHESNQRKHDTDTAVAAEEIDKYRRVAVEQLVNLGQRLYGQKINHDRPIPVTEITSGIIDFLEDIHVRETLSQWHRQSQQKGDLIAATTHEQVYSDLVDLFDDLVEALGAEMVTLTEYSEILSSALANMTLALVPPAIDQVLIGNIERSRHPHIRAAFVLGVNDRYFPKVTLPDAFFTDTQRRELMNRGLELAPTSTQRLLRERYLGYIAMTRAHDFLWLSYAASDQTGETLTSSSLIDAVGDAVSDVPMVYLQAEETDNTNAITNIAQLGQHIAAALSDARAGKGIEPLWGQLYRQLCCTTTSAAATTADDDAANQQTQEFQQILDCALAGVTWSNDAKLQESTIKALAQQCLYSSVSRLESYAACPFKHFSRYVLNLEPRRQLQLGALDLGSFYHDVLNTMFTNMRTKGLSWKSLSEGQVTRLIEESTDKLLQSDTNIADILRQSFRNQYLLTHAGRRLAQSCHSLRDAAGASNFEQRYSELVFGDSGQLPAFELPLPNGLVVRLYGRIDRVDVADNKDGSFAVSVVDYKSSTKSFSFGRFYHGLSLQLITYLAVLAESYRPGQGSSVIPVAALFMPITQPGTSHSEQPPVELLDGKQAENPKHCRGEGPIDYKWIRKLDTSVKEGQDSEFYKFSIKKNGGVKDAKRSCIVEGREMQLLLEHNLANLIRLAGGIIDGDIAVKPYRMNNDSPCSFCDYDSVCRFDPLWQDYRHIVSYNKQQVFKKLTEKREALNNE